MPRENRKRGKRHKRGQEGGAQAYAEEANFEHEEQEEQEPGPSWIVSRTDEQADTDAPFGYVDPDVKAYFKTVGSKLREWQEIQEAKEEDEGGEHDPNEERRMFLVAALTELSGKEKQLATDPECSNVLERMAYSMDDFVKRVFMDRLAGSYIQLCRHRFGSHVIQTMLSVAKGTILREAEGIFPPASDSEDEGDLPTLTQLILSFCEELLPSVSSLILDPFASHVLRALFLLLCPVLPSADQPSSILRSKKSAKHRAKQGPMKSVLSEQSEEVELGGKGEQASKIAHYPMEFEEMAIRFVDAVRDGLSANEVRALAADKVACPVLFLLLEMESIQGRSNESGSLMDSVSAGLISGCLKLPPEKTEPSDYVSTLLREPTSSHLLEKLVSLAPEAAFNVLWEQYFQGKLNKLAVHPVANFVVARAIQRLDADWLLESLAELEGSWTKIIKSPRTGVLKAAVDRSTEIKAAEAEICSAIYSAIGCDDTEKRKALVWCILFLCPYDEYAKTLKLEDEQTKQVEEEGGKRRKEQPPLEPTVQGSVLAQSLLRLSEPHNQIIIESITSQPPASLLALAHHPISSRILDVFISSDTVPARFKRKLILSFLEHYHELVDDRIGSRVGDRLWAAADPYLKEKIARSLVPHEQALIGSYYGKFFVRGLNLYLLKRNPEEWKALQAKGGKKDHPPSVPTTTIASTKGINPPPSKPAAKPAGDSESKGEDASANKTRGDKKKRKREQDKPEDEIDAVFSAALGKKQKKGNLGPTVVEEPKISKDGGDKPKGKTLSVDRDLDNVLGAIRSAPKDLKESKKKQ